MIFINKYSNLVNKILEQYYGDEYEYDDYLDELCRKNFDSSMDMVFACEHFKVNCRYLYFDQNFDMKEHDLDLGYDKYIQISGNQDSYYSKSYMSSAGICQNILLSLVNAADHTTEEDSEYGNLCFYQNLEYRSWKKKQKEKKKKKVSKKISPLTLISKNSKASDGRTLSFFKSDNGTPPSIPPEQEKDGMSIFGANSSQMPGSEMHHMSDFDGQISNMNPDMSFMNDKSLGDIGLSEVSGIGPQRQDSNKGKTRLPYFGANTMPEDQGAGEREKPEAKPRAKNYSGSGKSQIIEFEGVNKDSLNQIEELSLEAGSEQSADDDEKEVTLEEIEQKH